MSRLAKILALGFVIGLLAAPSALARPLQPPLPPDARSAPASSSQSDTSEIALASGLGVLLVGAALYPLSRRRRDPAPV